MASALQLLREGRTEELWQKCCGFIDLSMEQFMAIQRRLLLEQIALLNKCELGNKVMRGAKPRSVEEFREQTPITTYTDYVPYLPERKEDALPAKPLLWQHTAGRRCYSGEYAFKWIPVTEKIYRELGDTCLAMLLFASCKKRGEIVLEEHDKFLYAMAPPPYASGSWSRRAAEEGIFKFLPPLDEAEKMAFEKRIQEGFRMGLSEGIDHMMALAGVLIAVAGQLGRNIELKSAVSLALRGKLPLRYAKAILMSKLAGRPVLPKDIWTLKALVSMGMDATVYREKIKRMWGRYPLSVYGSTETVIMATQLWDYGAMTFLPHTNFLEFIPEGECRRWLADPTYRPHVFTLDEVKTGENYGIVATNFYGGALVRYFLGDVIKITSLRNEKLNVNIPQMVFYSRLDSIIDIDGVVIMPEGYVWQAVEDSGLAYRDWVVKQSNDGKHRLHFYIESKNGMALNVGQAAMAISKELRAINPYYSTLEDAGDVVLEVTQLPSGAFRFYAAKQRATGADLAHLKPPHVNPSDEIISLLVNPLPKSLSQKDSSA